MEVANRTATTLLGRTTAPAILGTNWAMTTTAVQVCRHFNSLHCMTAVNSIVFCFQTSMNVQLKMVVVISTVTTLLGHITVPVTVAGDWILMNILAMVNLATIQISCITHALSQSSQTPMSARRTSQAAHRYVLTTLVAMFVRVTSDTV